jgi:hypothetical protein
MWFCPVAASTLVSFDDVVHASYLQRVKMFLMNTSTTSLHQVKSVSGEHM